MDSACPPSFRETTRARDGAPAVQASVSNGKTMLAYLRYQKVVHRKDGEMLSVGTVANAPNFNCNLVSVSQLVTRNELSMALYRHGGDVVEGEMGLNKIPVHVCIQCEGG